MRWFFLPFIPLLAVVGNLALLSELSLFRVLGSVAFNLFVLSLVSLWWHAYFGDPSLRSRRLVLTHAVFILSFALGIAVAGASIVSSGSCTPLASARRHGGLLSSLSQYAESVGYCRELGVLLAVLGAFLAYPSLRLFSSLRKDA